MPRSVYVRFGANVLYGNLTGSGRIQCTNRFMKSGMMMDCSSFSRAGSSGSEVLNRSSGASIGADFFSSMGLVSALRSAPAADFSGLRDGRGSCLCRSAPQTVQKVCRVSIGSPQNGQRMIITSLITGRAGVQFTPLWIYYTPSVNFCQLFHSKIGISSQ